ncbi:MAG: hypothetical protein ABWY18_07480 [Tardiphaga sp.]
MHAQTFGYGGKNPAVATNGATLIHGNYCGAGNRPGKPPIDALDLACMNHDACSPTGAMPTCECNLRLRDEAFAVSRDPRQTPELRSLASLTAAAATVMLCNPMTTDVVVPAPPVQPTVAPVVQAPLAPLPAPSAAQSVPTAAVAQTPVATAPAAPPPMAAPSPTAAAPMSIVPAGAAPPPPADPAPADDDPD